jgi:hypothetical protein
MFYYSGHGGMTNGKTFLYPSDEDYLFRDELETIVNKKENRFKIILTDACSSSIDSIKSIRAINKAGTIPKNEKEEIYKTLFLKYKGTLSFSAATEGQFAIGADDGGLFTKSLFKEVLSKDPSPSWEMIFEKTKEKTEHKFKDLFNKGVTKGEFENLLLEIIANMFANEVTIDQDTQTPKAYSMPVPIGNEDIENTTSWKTEPDNPPVYNKNIEAKIKNKTKNNIVFYIDRNPKDLDESKWDWTISKKVYIKANETITLKEQPPLRIFYDSSEKGVLEYVEIEEGSYYFDIYNGNLYIEYDYE